MFGWLVFNPNRVSFYGIYTMKRSELTNGKGPNLSMEKVRINQEKRSELTKEFFLLGSELTNKKFQTDQWSRSELTSGRGPNRLGPNSLKSRDLTRAELAKVRFIHNSPKCQSASVLIAFTCPCEKIV